MDAAISPEIKKFITDHIGTAGFEVVQLAGDASARKYYRIGWDERNAPEKTLVMMLWEPFPDIENYPLLNVQKHFAKHDVNVPRIETYSSQLGIILQEDLGDLTLERKFWENQNQETSWPLYFQAVDELIKIHFACSQQETPPSVCQTTVFDTAKFMWEMNYAREHMLDKVGAVKLSDKDAAALQTEFLKICEYLDQQPKFVCHRDYHSRNLMLKMGKLRVIDFQDARKGPLQYDLVSLVHDSYVNLAKPSIDAIKDEYIHKAKLQKPKGVNWDEFEGTFKVQTIQRCFKACGSFSSFWNMRQDSRYLKYILPTIKLVASSLEEYKSAPLLTSLLRNHGFLEKNYEALCAP
jgi:aminoglycoside/choline kinase family phosphotransferase